MTTPVLRSRRGFVLIELLVCIALYLIAASLFTSLMRSCLRATDASTASSNAIYQSNMFVQALRLDVWQASRITVADAHSLQLDDLQGRSIVWKLNPDSATRLDQSSGTMSKTEYHVGGASITEHGSVILVTIPSSSIRGGGTFELPSQILLAKAGAP